MKDYTREKCMLSQAKTRMSVEEYLAFERQAPYKSEYFNGEVFAMSGASRRHNLISLNIGAELRAQLRQRPCEVYTSDMRVKITRTGLYTYPDVVVVCEEATFEDADVDTLLNPTLLVEVLSKTTEDYDRGGKFEHYRTLPSVQEYLLVAQERCHIVHYTRQPDNTWLLAETDDISDHIRLPSLGCDLALSEVYAKVHFPS
jgi:Uma2 family endonuclease